MQHLLFAPQILPNILPAFLVGPSRRSELTKYWLFYTQSNMGGGRGVYILEGKGGKLPVPPSILNYKTEESKRYFHHELFCKYTCPCTIISSSFPFLFLTVIFNFNFPSSCWHWPAAYLSSHGVGTWIGLKAILLPRQGTRCFPW
jgi:hypothetical protein